MYNKLLEQYVVLLEAEPVNPYEFSIRQRIRDYFNIKGQVDYATSPQINDFIKTPDTLAQELPASKEMLKKLDTFDDQAIRAFTKLNTMNLVRLRRRSIRNQIFPGIAFSGSVVGLLLNLQDFLAISIKDSFAWLSRSNLSLLFQGIIILILVVAIGIARINWMFTNPRIGLVDAFGDVVDPKNWRLPLGVEFTRKEVYYVKEAQKF
jgi:hypothetical protein